MNVLFIPVSFFISTLLSLLALSESSFHLSLCPALTCFTLSLHSSHKSHCTANQTAWCFNCLYIVRQSPLYQGWKSKWQSERSSKSSLFSPTASFLSRLSSHFQAFWNLWEREMNAAFNKCLKAIFSHRGRVIWCKRLLSSTPLSFIIQSFSLVALADLSWP